MAVNDLLPEYDQPPIVEVALAMEFKHSVNFTALQLGALAEGWRDILPSVEERSNLPRMELASGDLLEALFEIEETASKPPRLWLANEAGDRVVQIQHDRLVVNWRKGQTEGEYPRYGTIREFLEDAWVRLLAKCSELGHDAPVPFLCEVQYINHLGAAQGWNSAQDTVRLIVPWQGMGNDNYLPEDHLSQFSLHCHFPEEREGWLTIDGWAPGDSEASVLMLSLTSRGRALEEDLRSALAFMDAAHVWIVKGFTAVTTEKAHEIWRRTR